MHVLIMAGGVGSRLWPKSRQATPKQFLNLTGQETMIQTTVRRILPIVSPEKIFVATGQRYLSLVQQQLPMLPKTNIIGEISGKNTAPAIGLGAIHIQQVDPNAIMAVLTADHIIPDEDTFRNALLAAESVAKTGKLVTLGVTPTGPETGYGYIHRGNQVGQYNNQTVYTVKQFLEKPNLSTAEKFYKSGDYYWNSGMFIWQLPILFKALEQHMPPLLNHLQQLKTALFKDKSDNKLKTIWAQIESQSIDFGLMEKAKDVAVVPLNAGWNDVGSWAALYDELAQTPTENVVLNAQHLSIESKGLLIQGTNKLIATIGLENLVIIETEDALLICAKDKVQGVKEIVNQLKEQNNTLI